MRGPNEPTSTGKKDTSVVIGRIAARGFGGRSAAAPSEPSLGLAHGMVVGRLHRVARTEQHDARAMGLDLDRLEGDVGGNDDQVAGRTSWAAAPLTCT